MWPFSSYPEHSPSQVNGKTYDYIVVGGGTAGCVVASRLSEDHDVSVLVVDKGRVKDNIVSRMPLASQNTFIGNILQVQGNRWSEPIPSANRRRNRLWGVEGIGGASRINAMLWTRGFPGDYAAWSEMGLEDWDYDKVEPYFRKIENAIAHPDSESRGHKGPMELRQFTFPFVWTTYLERAIQKLGIRLEKDINNPAAPAMGSFNLDTAIDNLASQRRDQLTVCTGAVASRLESNAQTGIVTGVHIRCSKGPPGEFFAKARREAIVCSGALCTPQLLLLGIPLTKELPAVDTTLSDHYSIPIMLEVSRKETFHLLETVWAIWHILLWFLFGKGFLSLSAMSTTIYVRTSAIDKSTMEVKSHDEEGHDTLDASLSRNVPDIEVMPIPVISIERPFKGHAFISLYPTLAQPRGLGRVELANTDSLAQPRIIYPMFTTKHDISSARLAVRFTIRLADELLHSGYPYPAKLAFAPGQDPSMLEEWERTAPVDYLPVPVESPVPNSQKPQFFEPKQDATGGFKPRENKTWRNVTDDEIDDYSRRVCHASSHFSSTCPMSNDEKSGVVDQKLRVHGFSNLRIADASVFPRIPSCHTMAPMMMVGERCADMVKATWEGKKFR
ncbi:putative GMC oxidoreductase [Hypoxylon sp. FL1857]|nr:putative GMC oxidoreductase [Hypoxylon sp. FL1857]